MITRGTHTYIKETISPFILPYKVGITDTPKYTTCNDEGSSSDDNDDLTSLFANLTKDQKKYINELIETIDEKGDILECQEDLLVKENKKFVKLKNAYSRSRKM
jgi:hypothetical protein